MLIIEDDKGVDYQNQVGGVVCWQAELKGILSPLEVDPESTDRIMNCPYPTGREGITDDIADTIDEILALRPSTSFLTVDRSRLDECWEAWIHVLIDSPLDDAASDAASASVPLEAFTGPIRGFGRARGVLTWPNSD